MLGQGEKMRTSLGNERGIVLISTMLILVLVTILGVSALNTSITEIQIAGNDKTSRMAFYHSDGGTYSSAKLISQALDAGEAPAYSGLSYDEANPADPGDFLKKVMGFIEYADTRDAELVTATGTVEIDIRSRVARHIVGGGVEFATGSAGAGVGSIGGVEILFRTRVTGIAANNSRMTIENRYSKVLGTSGGL
jgi:Tfp pilus assembly protein PilX